MSLFPIVIVAAVCFAVCETKERTASLVVLPPLVLGYDELYHDSQEGEANNSKNGERDTPQRQRDPQRTIIDTRGRRRHFRRHLKERDIRNALWPPRSRYASVPVRRRYRVDKQFIIGRY